MKSFRHMLHRRFRSVQKQTEKNLQAKDGKNHAKISEQLGENLHMLQKIYSDCSDIVFHDFFIGKKTKAALIYVDGLSNVEEVDRQVLSPLCSFHSDEHTLTNIRNQIPVSSIKYIDTIEDAIAEIASGNPVLLIDKEQQGLSIGLPMWEMRAIQEPAAESVLRGPREGFIESIRVNTAILRRKVRSPKLKVREIKIGTYTVTPVVISYIEGVAAPNLVEEVMSRIERIETDGILDSMYIEEMIEDNPHSPFSQLLSTERPDVASSYLLEGYVVILVEGSPSALIAPTTLFSLLQSPEDYYERFVLGTVIRWLRYMFFGISLLAPSFYIAVITFHQEMIPTALLLTMATSREHIPFPALVEALLMETMFEALREAGARLPKQIGTAVSIVGALVIGQAAISAGIVSAPMVMVVAITGVASFMAPRFIVGISVRILRFPMMFLAGILGLLGLILGIILILNHLLKLRSFGVPYLSPLAPLQNEDLKDVLWRVPSWKMITRPHLTGNTGTDREPSGQKPGVNKGDRKR